MTDQRFAELRNEINRQKKLPNLYKAKSKCKYVRKHGCSILAVDDCRKFGKCKWFKKGGGEDGKRIKKRPEAETKNRALKRNKFSIAQALNFVNIVISD